MRLIWFYTKCLCMRLKQCYTCMLTKRIWTRLVLTAMIKLKTAISMTDDDGDCVIPGLWRRIGVRTVRHSDGSSEEKESDDMTRTTQYMGVHFFDEVSLQQTESYVKNSDCKASTRRCHWWARCVGLDGKDKAVYWTYEWIVTYCQQEVIIVDAGWRWLIGM